MDVAERAKLLVAAGRSGRAARSRLDPSERPLDTLDRLHCPLVRHLFRITGRLFGGKRFGRHG